MNIGDKIRLLRNEKKVSIRKLADLTGLSKSTLSDVENSVSKKPTIDTVSKIAKALEVPVSELFDQSEMESTDNNARASTDKKASEAITENIEKDEASNQFLRSVARAKDHPKETQEKIAAFINLILDQEDNKNE